MNRWSLIGWLLRVTRPLLPRLTLSVLARVVGHLLSAAVLVLAAYAVLHAVSGSFPVVAIWWIVGLSLAKAGLRFLEHHSGHWVAFTALQHLRELYFSRLVPQAPAATTGRASSELTEVATADIDRIEVFYAHTIPPALSAVLVPAAALTWFGIAVDATSAWIMGGVLLVGMILPFVLARGSWGAARDQASARGGVAVQVADDAQGLREILAFQAGPARKASLGVAEAGVSAASVRLGTLGAWRGAASTIVWCAGLVALVLVGDSVEATVMAVALFVSLWASDAGTEALSVSLDPALAACARVRSVIEAEPLVQDSGVDELSGTGAVSVALDRVGFTYPGACHATMADVSLAAPAGSWTYVCGVSGSGKSTLAGLVTRGWDVSSGEVSVGGVPVRLLALSSLRAAVVAVDQRPVLFPGTVAENLRLGSPSASDDELMAALRVVDLDSSLPQGLATRIGDGGAGISGGQLQRVALARALVMRPRLLILDEALSQLDARTAAVVRARLGELDPAPTVLEVTHRTDMIPDQASVVVIDRGRIVDRGTAGQLRAADGPFARLALRA
jgi:ABC-type transport system involved in cytochrome bd biosynthesis fused ATPase/permease subunit